MDSLSISSYFMKGIVSKLIRKKVKEAMGFDVEVELDDISLVIDEGKARLVAGCTIETDKENIASVLKL